MILYDIMQDIGYSICKSKRRQGYATEMLKLVLQECDTRGIHSDSLHVNSIIKVVERPFLPPAGSWKMKKSSMVKSCSVIGYIDNKKSDYASWVRSVIALCLLRMRAVDVLPPSSPSSVQAIFSSL